MVGVVERFSWGKFLIGKNQKDKKKHDDVEGFDWLKRVMNVGLT